MAAQRPFRRLQRDAFLISRAAGDADALQRGPDVLAKRLVRRVYHRKLIGLLRRGRVW